MKNNVVVTMYVAWFAAGGEKGCGTVAGKWGATQVWSVLYDHFSQISFDGLLGSQSVCLALRQMMILVLPDRVAGPGGWFIDTGTEEKA